MATETEDGLTIFGMSGLFFPIGPIDLDRDLAKLVPQFLSKLLEVVPADILLVALFDEVINPFVHRCIVRRELIDYPPEGTNGRRSKYSAKDLLEISHSRVLSCARDLPWFVGRIASS